MSPFLQRELRAMSTWLVVFLCVAFAAALAWWVHRYDARRIPPPSPCAHVLDDVFSEGVADTPDAVLLAALLKHRSECLGDPIYVDQVRRLMVNTQQIAPARALLAEAKRRRTFAPDELKAQIAWVDLAAAHTAWVNGQESQAEKLRAAATASAHELRQRWPEWPLPYLILDEAERAHHRGSAEVHATDFFQMGRSARHQVLNGAAVRNFSEVQTAVFVFVTAAIGTIALSAGVSGLVAMREMTRLKTSAVSVASPGYVELRGTLHVLPGAEAVIGPLSKAQGVWYEVERTIDSKATRSIRERSSQPFVLRDASGEAIIDPREMQVVTRHSITKFGASGGVSSSKRTSELMLKEGDTAYVLGELTIDPSVNASIRRHVRVAQNGRRLLVSNFTEDELVFGERVWFWSGVTIFALATLLLAWAYYQRYHVIVTPGVLP
jgi:hypothetical protein